MSTQASAGSTGTPVPSSLRYIVGAGLGRQLDDGAFVGGVLAPQGFGGALNLLAPIRTPANPLSSSPALAKLTSAAANPTIRVAPGVSDESCRPNPRSRGLAPAR